MATRSQNDHVEVSYHTSWSPDLKNLSIYLKGRPASQPGMKIAAYNKDLVSAWKLDDPATPVIRDSKNENHGTPSGDISLGNVSTLRKGDASKSWCAYFDGVNDQVQVPSGLLGSSFSITGWVKIDSGTRIQDQHVIFSQYDGSTGSFWFGLESDAPTGRLYVTAYNKEFGSLRGDTPFWFGDSILVSVTFNNGDVRIYLNTNEENRAVFTNPPPSTTGRIGTLDGTQGFYIGYLHDLYVWSAALPQEAIAELYCGRSGTEDKSRADRGLFYSDPHFAWRQPPSWTQNLAAKDIYLKAVYHLDETTTNLPQDSKGPNHATASNIPMTQTNQMGKWNRSFWFGQSHYFIIPWTTPDDFTLSFWVKGSNINNYGSTSNNPGFWDKPGGGVFLFDQGNNARCFQLYVIMGVLNVSLWRYDTTDQYAQVYNQPSVGQTALWDGEWHHIVVTRVKATGRVKVYIDSERRLSAVINCRDSLDGRDTLYVGRYRDSGAYGLSGNMDEISIWSTELSGEDVKELYNRGYGSYYGVVEYPQEERSLILAQKENLKAAWIFADASVKDSLNKASGKLNGSITLAQAGKTGNCMRFGGTGSDYISFNHCRPFLQAGTTDFTIGAWVYGISWSSSPWIIYDTCNDGSQVLFGLQINSSGQLYGQQTMRLYYWGAYMSYATTTASISTGAWHHVTLVYQCMGWTTPTFNFYVDGALLQSITGTGSTYILGASREGVNRRIGASLNGYLEQVCIWNQLLPAEAIAELYQGGSGLPLDSWYSDIKEPSRCPQSSNSYCITVNPRTPWPAEGNSIKARRSSNDLLPNGSFLTSNDAGQTWSSWTQDETLRVILGNNSDVVQEVGSATAPVGTDSGSSKAIAQSFRTVVGGVLDKLELNFESQNGSGPGECVLSVYEGTNPSSGTLLTETYFTPTPNKWTSIPVEPKYMDCSWDRYRDYHIYSWALTEEKGRRWDLCSSNPLVPSGFDLKREDVAINWSMGVVGLVGNAARFDSSSMGLILDSEEKWTRDFTLSLVFKTYDVTRGQRLVHRLLSETDYSLKIFIEGSLLKVILIQSNRFTVVLQTAIESNRIYLLGLTSDGNSLSLYLDGVQVASTIFDGTLHGLHESYQLRVGEYFYGWIEQINLWSVCFSEAEILELYNQGQVKYYKNSSWNSKLSVEDGSLITAWKFDDGKDSKGNNDLVIPLEADIGVGKDGGGLLLTRELEAKIGTPSSELDLTGSMTLSGWIKAAPTSYFHHKDLDGYDSSLKVAWTLDGNYRDIIGGYDLGASSSDIQWGVGVNPGGLSFYSPNQSYGSLSRGWDSSLFFSPITISLWISGHLGYNTNTCYWINLSDGIYFGREGSNQYAVRVNIMGTWKYIVYDYRKLEYYTRWHNLVLTYDGIDLKLYVNGLLAGQTFVGGMQSIQYSNSSIYVGKEIQYPVCLDEIYIWNVGLPQSAVTALYNEGTGRFLKSNPETVIARGDHGDSKSTHYDINLDGLGGVTSNLYVAQDLSFNTTLTAYNSNLKGVWRFNEPSGQIRNQIDGEPVTAYGRIKYGLEGVSGQKCLELDGGSGYLDLGNKSYTRSSTFTISAWASSDVTGGDSAIFGCHYREAINGNSYGYAVLADGSLRPVLGYYSDGDYSWWDRKGFKYEHIWDTRKWYHLVLQYVSGTIKLYVNGVLVCSKSESLSYSGNERFRVGVLLKSANSDYRVWGGLIHDLYLWDTALSTDAITALYNNGLGRFWSPQLAANPPLIIDGFNDSVSDYPVIYGTRQRTNHLRELRTYYNSSLASYRGLYESAEGTKYSYNLNPSTRIFELYTKDHPRALGFDGSTAYVSITDNAALRPTALSVSLWCFPRVLSNCGLIIKRVGISGNNANWQVELQSSGNIRFSFYDTISASWKAIVTTTAPVSVSQWNHVSVTYKNQVAEIWVGGVQLAYTNTWPVLNTSDSGPVQIGRGEYGYFNGILDEVYFWNDAISAAAVVDLHTKGHGKFYHVDKQWVGSLRAFDPSLAVMYHFEETSGSYFEEIQSLHALVAGSPTRGSSGIYDNGIEFTGSGSNGVYIPISESMNFTSITVSFWIKADSWSNNSGTISLLDSYYRNTGVGDGVTLRKRNVSEPLRLSMYFENAGGLENFVTADSVISDLLRWHHLAFTWDAATRKLYFYVDGVRQVSEATTPSGISRLYTKKEWDLGRTGTGTEAFDGRIDELYIWYTALDGSAITDLYNDRAGRFYCRHDLPDLTWTKDLYASELSLESSWDLQEVSGNPEDKRQRCTSAVAGGITYDLVGVRNRAFGFDGSSGYLDLSANSELIKTSASQWTVSLWVYGNAWGQSGGTTELLYESVATNDSIAKFRLFVDNQGRVGSEYRNDPSGSAISLGLCPLGNALPLSQWNHICLIVDTSGSNASYYLNGQLALSFTFTGGVICPSAVSRKKFVGASYSGSARYFFSGRMQEVNIWSTKLTSPQILTLYNGGNGKFYSPDPAWSSTLSAYNVSLVSAWHFEETSGVLYDDVSSNNGTGSGTLTYNEVGHGLGLSYWKFQGSTLIGNWTCISRKINGAPRSSLNPDLLTVGYNDVVESPVIINLSGEEGTPALSILFGSDLLELYYDQLREVCRKDIRGSDGNLYRISLYPISLILSISQRGSLTPNIWEFQADGSLYGTWTCFRRVVSGIRQEPGSSGSISVTGPQQSDISPPLIGHNPISLFTSKGLIVQDHWHHLCFVGNTSSGTSLYLDGELKASNTTPFSSSLCDHPTENLYVGGPGDLAINMDIDDIYIWQDTLADEQVSQLYNGGIGRFKSSSNDWTGIISETSSNLFAVWRFDETYGPRVDLIQGISLSPRGTSTSPSWAHGLYGNCARFQSTNTDYLTSAAVSALRRDIFTLSVWFRPTYITSKSCLVCADNDAVGNGWRIFVDPQSARVTFVGRDTNGYNKEVSATWNANTSWNHLVVVANSGTVTLYINGEKTAEGSIGGSFRWASFQPPIYVGAYYNGSYQYYYDGDLDELYLWSTALSESYIQALYNSGSGRFFIPKGATWTDILRGFDLYLVSVWRMEETTGTRFDYVGTNNLTSNNSVGYTTGKFGTIAANFVRYSYQRLTRNNSQCVGLNFTNNFTISVWVKPNTIPTAYEYPIYGRWATQQFAYRLLLDYMTGIPRFDFSSNGEWQGTYLEGTTVCSPLSWHNIVVVYDGGTLKLYVDRNLEDSMLYSADLKQSTSAFEVGGLVEQGIYFDGAIDELYIWSVPLSPSAISDLYEAVFSKSSTWDARLQSQNPNLISGWTFDETAGDAYDLVASRLLTNEGVSRVSGIHGNAVDFNGTSSDLRYNALDSLFKNLTQFTVSLWFRVDSVTSGKFNYILWEPTDVVDNTRVWVRISGTDRRVQVAIRENNPLPLRQVQSNSQVTLGIVHHLVVVFSSIDGYLRIYLNGNLEGELLAPLMPIDEAPGIGYGYLGVRKKPGVVGVKTDFFDGMIDEFYLWNQALLLDDITELYNGGIGRFISTSRGYLIAGEYYNLVIKCEPYRETLGYSYVNATVREGGEAGHYYNDGLVWHEKPLSRLAYRVYLNGALSSVNYEGGGSTTSLGSIGLGRYSVGQIFQTGLEDEGELTRIDLQISSIVSKGVSDVKFELRQGPLMGEGVLIAKGSIAEISTPGWASCYSMYPEIDQSWTENLRLYDSNILAIWPLEELDTKKDIYNGNDLYNSATTQVEGIWKIGAHFDSYGRQYLSRPASELLAGLDQATLSIWVRLDQVVGHDRYLFWEGASNGTSARFALFVAAGGRVAVSLCDDSGGTHLFTSTALMQISKWSNLVVIFKGRSGSLKVFLNGVTVIDQVLSFTTLDSGANPKGLYLGAYNGEDIGGLLDGSLDEVYLWNNVLADLLASELYNSGKGRFFSVDTSWVIQLSEYDENLISSWMLNDNTKLRMDGKNFNHLTPSNEAIETLDQGRSHEVCRLRVEPKDYLIVDDAAQRGLNISSESISVLLWVQLGDYLGYTLYSKGYSGNLAYHLRVDTSGMLVSTLYGSSTQSTVTSSTALPKHQWNMVVVIYDRVNNLHSIYLNSVLVASASFGVNLRTNNGPFVLGAELDGSLNLVEGLNADLSDVLFWKTPIDEDAITILYNKGYGRIYNIIEPGWTSGIQSFNSALVSVWKMEETDPPLRDSYRTNNAAPYGGVTLGLVGKDGHCVYLDGTTGYLDAGNDPLLDFATSFTMVTWIKPYRSSGTILCKGDASSGEINYFLRTESKNVKFDTWVGGIPYSVTFGLEIQVSKWNFVALTYDGKALTAYVNGAKQEYPFTRLLVANLDPLYIGARKSGAGIVDPFRGLIDETCLWNSALTEGAITDLYGNGRGRFYQDPDWSQLLEGKDNDLVRVWDFGRVSYKHEAPSEFPFWRVSYPPYDWGEFWDREQNSALSGPPYIDEGQSTLTQYNGSLNNAWIFDDSMPPIRDIIGGLDLSVSGQVDFSHTGPYGDPHHAVKTGYGTSASLSAPATGLPVGNSPFSIAMWFWPMEYSGNDVYQFITWGSSGQRIALGLTSSRISVYSLQGGNQTWTSQGLSPVWGSWNLLTFTSTGSKFYVGLNRQLESFAGYTLDIAAQTTMQIGDNNYGGKFADTFLWKVPVDPLALQDIYLGKAVFDPSTKKFKGRGVKQAEGINSTSFGGRINPNLYLSTYDPDLKFTTKFTISVWVHMLSFPPGDDNRILSMGIPRGDNHLDVSRYGISTDSIGRTRGWVIGPDGSAHITQSYNASLRIHEWQNIVYVFDIATGGKLYANGQLVGENSLDIPPSIGLVDYTGFLSVGSRENGDSFTNYYGGDLDEVYFWDQSLDADVVKNLYNNGRGRFYGFGYQLPPKESYTPSSSSSSSSSSSTSTSMSSSSSSSLSSSSRSSSSSSSSNSSTSSSSTNNDFGWI